jgi:prophage tail gpP-like protein/phage tail protein X
LSITSKVLQGDTFASIARRVYGTEAEASRIRRANPGVSEPLVTGAEIVTPAAPDAPRDRPQEIPAQTENEVALLVDGERFRFWDSVRVTRSIDAMDTVEFGGPFDSTAPGMRETFRPFSYKALDIKVGGDQLFAGTMVAVDPVIANESITIAASGYSLPGVLNDCTPPPSSFPLEFNGQDLRGIAASIAGDFGLAVEFPDGPGPAFERVACDPGKKALAFLIELAQQRNLIVTNTAAGALVFFRPAPVGIPVAKLRQGESPVLSVTPMFSPQQYHSHITGIEPVVVGLAGSQFTVKNPRLQGVVRPITFTAQDVEGGDIAAAVEAKASRMFGSMASYAVRVSTWRDANGQLWAPDTTVTLEAPDAMVYSDYSFIVRSVAFDRDGTTETATLDLVIPGSFSGQQPEALPWEE